MTDLKPTDKCPICKKIFGEKPIKRMEYEEKAGNWALVITLPLSTAIVLAIVVGVDLIAGGKETVPFSGHALGVSAVVTWILWRIYQAKKAATNAQIKAEGLDQIE